MSTEKIEKILALAFHPSTGEDEAIAAFRHYKKLIQKDSSLAVTNFGETKIVTKIEYQTRMRYSHSWELKNINILVLPKVLNDLSSIAYTYDVYMRVRTYKSKKKVDINITCVSENKQALVRFVNKAKDVLAGINRRIEKNFFGIEQLTT